MSPSPSPKIILKGEALAKRLVKDVRTAFLRRKGNNPKNIGLLSEQGIVLGDVKEFIPTGFPNIDYQLGGGLPVGRAVEVYGPEGVGKTALLHMALKGCQSLGGVPVILDYEAALDMDKMFQLGIDPDRVVYLIPDHIEEGWDAIWQMMGVLERETPPAPVLFGWDSIAASVPEAELREKSSGSVHVGLIARSMSKGCRKMYKAVARTRACMLWINQIREKIGVMGFGDKYTTVGGRAVRFASSIRVNIAYRRIMKDGARKIGYEAFLRTVKNKLFPPHRETSFVIDFEHGPSPELTVLHHLIQARKIKATGDGKFAGVWSPLKFDKRDVWFACLGDPEFRAGALATYLELIKSSQTTGEEEDEE